MKKIKSFSEKNIERFSRQILIDEIGPKGQLNIMNSSIIVIGCGGLGTAAITYLSMLGIGRISIVDNDIVSLSNLNRQSLFSENDVDSFPALIYCSYLTVSLDFGRHGG